MTIRSTFATITALTLALATPIAAQEPATASHDPILQRIWAIGMDSSRVEQLAGTLTDSIGPRLTGTPILRSAQRWLVSMYRSWGIEATNERYGTWRGWRRGTSHVDLVSPRTRTLEATMLGFSPGTGNRPLVAEAIVLPHFEDSTGFVRWLPRARGKLVLVSAPPVACRPTSDFAQFATPEVRARIDSARAARAREWANPDVRGSGYSLGIGSGELGMRLEKGGVAGVLTTRARDAYGTRDIYDSWNTRAPALSLSCEDYGLVYRLAERGARPRLRLALDAQLLGEQPVFNTIATIPGVRNPAEYVFLSAHFDSWDTGSGATDNAAGSVIMLEAMRILKQAYPSPKRTIRVGHWTGEENGLVGSKAYREDHPDVAAAIHALFNHDNGTGRMKSMSVLGFPDGDVHARGWHGRLPEPFRTQVAYAGLIAPGRGGTDDFAFYCAGVPAFALGGPGWNYSPYTWHTERDTYDKLVLDDLRANATLVAMFVYLASEDSTTIRRDRVDLATVADSITRARALNPPPAGAPRPAPPLTEWPSCGAPAMRRTQPNRIR
jgi:hypothetical protein